MDMEAMDTAVRMPITGVTLYDNGYAVFERQTTVNGNGQIDLYFPKDLMKNVLESLEFLGDASANVGNIAYEATKPTANIEISESEPLLSLIRSLVGCQVVLHTNDGAEPIEGRVLGIEDNIGIRGESKSMEHVALYHAGGRLGMYPLDTIRNVSLSEEQVRQDISFSLDLTKNKSRDDMQKLSVFYSNVDSPKNLIARYGFQVSEWKSSYRMSSDPRNPNQLMLHGLAIIENSLWEDWNDVKVTLVVGAPAIHSEKEQNDEGVWRLVVKTLDGSSITIRANPKDSILAVKSKVAKKKGVSPFSFKLVFCGKAVEDGRSLSDYTINDNAVLHMSYVGDSRGKGGAGAAGTTSQAQFVMAAQDHLSYYQIPMHVTAQRKQKAIVTMLQTKLEGQQVVLYDETIRKGNPLSSILFENTTGRTLEGGSVILTTTEAFLGQSTLPTLSPGDESPPIPYAVELGCEVSKGNDSTYLRPHRIEIVDGNVGLYRIHREVTIYRISNKSEKQLDFLLNHLFLEQYDLVQNPNNEEEEPVDITDRFYQFRFQVDPKVEKKSFLVREEITDRKEYGIRGLDKEEFDRWVSKSYLDAPTTESMKKTFELRKQIGFWERDIFEKEGEEREINRNQSHIRENISALENHTKQAAKYINSLEEEEEKLKATKEGVKKARAKKKELEKQLTNLIASIKFEKNIPKPKDTLSSAVPMEQ